MKLTHALLGEHGVLYALLDQLGSGALKRAGSDAWIASLQMLEAALISHAQLEDTLLFPELAKHGLEQGPLPVMRAEHTEIERLLAAALVAPTPALAADLVGGMVQLTLEHFHKEEQVLFPMAEQLLGETLLLELGARWSKQRDVHVAR